jgi:hypothetical protein
MQGERWRVAYNEYTKEEEEEEEEDSFFRLPPNVCVGAMFAN